MEDPGRYEVGVKDPGGSAAVQHYPVRLVQRSIAPAWSGVKMDAGRMR